MRIVIHPNFIADPHADVCSRVINCLGQEYAPTHIILDSKNYSQDEGFIGEFTDIAFTWTRDRPTDGTPAYFVELTSDPTCTHVVWLSHKALAYSERIFVWVLAHELRHVYQSRHPFPKDETRRAVQRLRRELSYSNLPSCLFAPEEIDSELSALRVVGALYGADELNSFLVSNPLPRCPYSAYTRLLQEAATSFNS